MIVVDTSALMAILLDESGAGHCAAVLAATGDIAISAGTVAEALIVAGRRGLSAEMEQMISGLGMEIVPVTASGAGRVADAYGQWGKGQHPAALNFGDCFAYALAKDRGWPLLHVGEDFGRTDVTIPLHP